MRDASVNARGPGLMCKHSVRMKKQVVNMIRRDLAHCVNAR